MVMGPPSSAKWDAFQRAGLVMLRTFEKDIIEGSTLLRNQEGDPAARVDPSRHLDCTFRTRRGWYLVD